MDGLDTFRFSVFSVQDHYPGESRTLEQLYRQVLEQADAAEELGYDTFFVAEHHFHEYGAVPNPAVMLAAIAQRTTRLRLGSAISVATFHHPLTVAENYAMVDVLSGGRLVYGVGSGYLPHEYAGYGVDPETKRFRFDENLQLIERALSGQRISFEGEWNRLDDVAINVLPLQQPLPVYVAILRKEVAYHIGAQGRGILAVPYASAEHVSEIEGMVGEYQRGRREAGHEGSGDAVFALHAHVADTDEEARRVAQEPFERYVDSRLYARRQSYDDVLASGLALFGSVERVVGQLQDLHRMGVRHVMLLQNFGLMSQADVLRSMRTFSEQVVPEFREAVEEPALR